MNKGTKQYEVKAQSEFKLRTERVVTPMFRDSGGDIVVRLFPRLD